MAVAPTGDIFKAFTFDGQSSKTYGIYITGQAVYNAPERDVEMITIPARNGAFALDNGRFENITVSYPAGIFADNETDFAQAISDFRNYMCSREGYCRLEDEYNPDEYRMAIYKSGLEVTPAQLKAGEFEIIFECKPQRWLKSGEEKKTIGEWHDVVSASGSIIEFENNSNLEIKSAILTINPAQEGTGTPSPSNPRPFKPTSDVVIAVGRKNLIISSDCANRTESGITTTRNSNGSIHLSGTAESTERWWSATDNLNRVIKAGTYTLSPSNLELYTIDGYKSGTFTIENDSVINNARFILTNGAEYDETVYPQLELGTEVTEYESRLVTGYGITTASNVYGMVVDFAGDGTSYPAYTTVGHIDSYAGEEINEPWWSSIDEYVSGTTPSTGAEVVYTLETPTVSYFSSLSLPETRSGINVIYAPAQNATIEIQYGEDANSLVNPSLFKSSPLFEVKGYGTITINDSTSWEYNIELVDDVMGEVTVAEEQQFSANGKALANLPSSTFNVGDVITLAPSKFYWRVTATSSAVSGLAGGTPTESQSAVTTTSAGAGLQYYTNVPELTFTYTDSATETWTNVTTLPVTYTYNGSARGGSIKVTTKVLLSKVGTANRLQLQRSAGVLTGLKVAYTEVASTAGVITGDSTVSVLGNPTYIDLDIGEAYKRQTNPLTYVSLDKYLDLGSELPTFKTERNKITMSDTITELVITPRWWKV